MRTAGAVRAELGVREDAFVALMLAVLRPEKRADRFVDAVARAHALEPAVHGVVAGYGPERPVVERFARGSDAVRVLGHRDDVADLVGAADVVCLTSDVEGAPYAALEAMALARPVAAMDVGALPEVVEDGRTGLLVPAGDVDALASALVTLARNPGRARALGEAGRRRQRERFGADAMVNAHADLLRVLCAARSRTGASAAAATAVE